MASDVAEDCVAGKNLLARNALTGVQMGATISECRKKSGR
jgi:hypothetical protein